MKLPKYNVIPLLTVLFLVLLIIVIIVKHNPWKQEEAVSYIWSDIKPDQVKQLELTNNDQSIYTLIKDNDWRLITSENEATAAAVTQVDQFISRLSSLDQNNMVSLNKEKWPVFNLGEDQAYRISISGSTGDRLLFVSPDGTYYRLPDSNTVYKASPDLSAYFNPVFFQ